MSLIELIIYVLLLATFIAGSIVSAYGLFFSVEKEYQKEQQKEATTTPNHISSRMSGTNEGFIALISVFIISSILMLTAILLSAHHGDRFDIALHSEYRLMAHERAYACVDTAMLRLAQDYFYTVGPAPTAAGDLGQTSPAYLDDIPCTIDRIYIPDAGRPYEKMIEVHASAATGVNIPVNARISTLVSLSGGAVAKLRENFTFF
ncbi:hypothetical protein EB052_00395 [bacterium]|nr:hypothetical protein [bacterium]